MSLVSTENLSETLKTENKMQPKPQNCLTNGKMNVSNSLWQKKKQTKKQVIWVIYKKNNRIIIIILYI